MRMELLCALGFLCGADVVLAQQTPGYSYPSSAYYQGYAPAYPTNSGYYGYYYYPQAAYSGYYYPNYAYPRPAASNCLKAPNQAKAVRPRAGVAAAPAARTGTGITPVAQVVTEMSPVPDMLPGGPTSSLDHAEPTVVADHGLLSAPYNRDHNQLFWFDADYMLGWIKPDHLPGPLVTTGSGLDTNPATLGQPGTAILFGNSLSYTTMSGIKAEAGVFLDHDNVFSLDIGGFYFFPSRITFRANSDALGNPIIARPFNDLATGAERAELDSFPTAFPAAPFFPASGGSEVDSKSELYGFEVNGRIHSYSYDRLHLDFLGGFRYLNLTEGLSIEDQTTILQPNTITILNNGIPGNVLTDFDSFNTSNTFYGLQIGARAQWDQDWFFVRAFGKIAAGATQEKVTINGGTSLYNTPVGTETTSGGVLALPSNIGSYSRTVVGFVPEAGLTIGANITSWMRLTAGYSVLYWNAVARPGNEIDRNANSTQIPGDANYGQTLSPITGQALATTPGPLFHFNDSSFWLQTLNFGLEFHY